MPINDTHLFELDHRGRRLQSNYGPIRFHIIYNDTDVIPSTPTGQSIIRMMSIIQLFWQKTIEVYYLPALSFNLNPGTTINNAQCLGFQIPASIIQNAIPNKDIGILVEAKNDGDSGVTAYSYSCAYSQTTKQPLWGLLHWNIYYFDFSLISFQSTIVVGIHESTHLLGFSNIHYPNYLRGQQINNNQGSFINGSYMRQAIKDQFGCDNSSGMLLESGGGQGTSLSHWSYKVAYNEYMTSGVLLNNPTISFITLAVLEQTGWYKKIFKSYGKYLNWGYKKGCAMLSNSNCSSDEYCTSQDTKFCDYDQTALGYCKNDSLSNCLYIKFYANYICYDPNFGKGTSSLNTSSITGEVGGAYSRCFDATLYKIGATAPKYPFRCYKTLCSNTSKTLTVQIGNQYLLCLFPRQKLVLSGYNGYLTCPKSFTRICAVKRCPNECNANGICLNGKCLCADGFTGQSCSQKSSTAFSSVVSLISASQNNNCMVGSYLTIFGDCQACPLNCLLCTASGCTLCSNNNAPNQQGNCVL